MTYLDKFKLEHPDIVEAHTKSGHLIFDFGCPRRYGYEDNYTCTFAGPCVDCWTREIPKGKQVEEPVEIKIEEEKKMPKLSSIICDAILNSINDSDIEYAVKNAFEDYDYSDLIEEAVSEYLDRNISDIAEDTVKEAVRDYMNENL